MMSMPGAKSVNLDEKIVQHLVHIRNDFGQEYAFPIVFELELSASRKDIVSALARLCRDGKVKEASINLPELKNRSAKCYGLPSAGKPSLEKRR